MTDLSIERGREVYLVDTRRRRVRVCLQPSWAIVPGSRLTHGNRAFWTRTQTADTATSAVGIAGSAMAGVLWLVVASVHWIAYHLRRRRDWTVTVSAYESELVKLPGRREPATGRAVRTLDRSQHADFTSALDAAKMRANALVKDGYRPIRYPVSGDDQ